MKLLYCIFTVCYLLLVNGLSAQQNNSLPAKSEEKVLAVASVKDKVKSDIDQQIAEKNKTIIAEAVAAVNESKHALEALNKNNTDEALKALENVTAKLDVIIAREPKLALAPMAVTVAIQDLLVTPQAAKVFVNQAKKAMKDGEIQRARYLLCPLGYEVVLDVTSIPLATYPEAIRTIAPLIDQGQIKLAQVHLNTLLNTLVVTRHIIPLSFLKAFEMLKVAQSLSAIKDRNNAQNENIRILLEATREELDMADVLGYSANHGLKLLYKTLDMIEKKVKKSASVDEEFESMQKSLLGWIGNQK